MFLSLFLFPLCAALHVACEYISLMNLMTIVTLYAISKRADHSENLATLPNISHARVRQIRLPSA